MGTGAAQQRGHNLEDPLPCSSLTAFQVLETFITEWDQGRNICDTLLSAKESAQMFLVEYVASFMSLDVSFAVVPVFYYQILARLSSRCVPEDLLHLVYAYIHICSFDRIPFQRFASHRILPIYDSTESSHNMDVTTESLQLFCTHPEHYMHNSHEKIASYAPINVNCLYWWKILGDIPNAVTIRVGGIKIPFYEFPIIIPNRRTQSKVAAHRDTNISRFVFFNLQSGAKDFELAAQFYYDINLELLFFRGSTVLIKGQIKGQNLHCSL